MLHQHNHSKKLGIGIFLNLLITAIEYLAGFFSGSLALISDASHNLTDALSLIVASVAEKVSQRRSTKAKTYGYARATILGALLNTLVLFVLAIYIFYEAFERFQNPKEVDYLIVIIVGFATAIFNGIMAYLFSKDKKDLNMRGVFFHHFYDALSSIGALIGGILIYFTSNPLFDILISILIGVLMIISGWSLMTKTLHVLLEGVPDGIDYEEVENSILCLPRVKSIHDLHIWSVSSHFVSLSCHVLIDAGDQAKSQRITNDVKNILINKFQVNHSTIEIEMVKCKNGIC